MVRLIVAGGKQLLLSLKAAALVDGVIELGEGVGHLAAGYEQLEALGIIRVIGLSLCKRGYLNRVLSNKGRLNELLLDIFLEEEVEQIALLMSLLELYAALLCERTGGFQIYFRKVDAGIFLDGLDHRHAGKGL